MPFQPIKPAHKLPVDLLAILFLLACVLIYAATRVDFSIPPFEDAAMLMRYAQHLADGRGIVWNIGEAPLDGATDFFFMVSAAALIRLGLTVGQAVRGIGFASHLLTVVIIYLGNRRLHQSGLLPALLSALYLAFGTGLSYVSAYFGTPYFALAATLTWYLGLSWSRSPTRALALAFSLSALMMGLVRPEGVILAGLMLLALILLRGWQSARPLILTFVAVFLLLGGAYFLWRWQYFGHPLPNPFYKKGAAGLQWSSFRSSLSNLLGLCLPLVPAFLLGFRTRDLARQTLASLLPLIGFACAFILISDEMNYGARFQYALLPLALLSWYPLVRGAFQGFLQRNLFSNWECAVYLSALSVACLTLLYYSWYQNCFLTSYQQSCARPYERDGRYDMAQLLAQYRGKGYRIATTEAGLLPYYSGWDALDTWGLNDAQIARLGILTPEYLDSQQPEIIMFHDYYSPLVPPKLTPANLAQPWFRMTITMKDYAESHGYILAAVFGDSPYDTHYYYVRPDFPDSKRLVQQISSFKKYYWPTSGKRSLNYAGYSAP